MSTEESNQQVTMSETVETTEAVEVEVRTPIDQIADIVGKVETMSKELRVLLTELKYLKKDVTKSMKRVKRKKVVDPNKPKKGPSGFAMPTAISTELSAFLDIPSEELIARTEVTRRLSKYIKDNDLQNPENRREILFTKEGGPKLRELLNPNDGDVVTYFNLQRYLAPHFPKKVKPEPVEPPTPPPTPTPTEPPTTPTEPPTTPTGSEVKSRTARARVRRKAVAT